MAAPSFDPHAPFDPLVDLDGLWTPELADRYLPIPGMPPAKYECLDGKLIMSPYEGSANIYAADELYIRMRAPARQLGGNAYTTLNLEMPQFSSLRWTQPDFAVLREPARGRVWIPAQAFLLVGECVSRSTRRNDYVDKPAEYAKAGIPYFMRVEIKYEQERASVELLRLEDGTYRDHAKALSGQTFETDLPFPLSFDPIELLEL
ncbi:Uma2 family endonuclease [Saccharopolyspora sp. NPDC002686]|uniref:Uma2 family endonuclease n=1 Tax=Saccharopolyspora sp. NPDC002686 TaxID=3154541 RepID=UPI003332DC05